jgi:hypothetical protein
VSVVGCASVQESARHYEPKKFDIIVASESEILDAAYEALLEVYPYALFFPLLTQQPGYYWSLEYWEIDPYYHFPTSDRYDSGHFDRWTINPYYNNHPNNQYEFRLKKTHGFTKDGDLMQGYQYEIISYGMDYINDINELHHLDIVFRSELFKRHIDRIEVAEMVSINRNN